MSKTKKLQPKTNMFISGTFDENKFAKILYEKRTKAGLSRSQLASLINRQFIQIQRYETPGSIQQFPPLKLLVELCVLLQINPLEILNVEISESGACNNKNIINNFSIYKDRLHWYCIDCGCKNSDYDNYTKLSHKDISNKKLACEVCGYYHDGIDFSKIKENIHYRK